MCLIIFSAASIWSWHSEPQCWTAYWVLCGKRRSTDAVPNSQEWLSLTN